MNTQMENLYTFNEIDGGYFIDAVKAMSDSTYSGLDLANRLYVHAYSQSVLTANKVADTALDELAAATNTDLMNMVAPSLFGGKTMPRNIAGVRGSGSDEVAEKDLINGDILLVDDKVYAYADGLWLLENGATREETAAVLNSLSQANQYAVLRPSIVLEGIITPSDPDAPLDVLNDYQKALIATAEAYLLRGEKLQYSDTRFTVNGSKIGAEYRWQSKVIAPEDCTSDNWGYSNCAAFTYEVYYQALGFTLPNNMYSTNALVRKSVENGTLVYHYARKLGSVQTDEEKAQIEKEYLELLQPGDIVVILREGGYGHAMLYVGNGNLIHSSGGVYKYAECKEVYEATIRRMKAKDYLFNPASTRGYVFNLVEELAIVRPLQIVTLPIPQNTLNRLENMQGIMAQKLSSHSKARTVSPGEEMTFTYEIYNTNAESVTLDVVETLPENTTYLSGAENVNGNTLSWKVDVPADSRVQVAYTLKVNADAPYGSTIGSAESTVGGVIVKCPAAQVQKNLTVQQQTKLIEAVQELRASENTLAGLELVNKLYEMATGTKNVFVTTDASEIMEGANGIFTPKQMSLETVPQQIYQLGRSDLYGKMVAPTLYGGYRMWTALWKQDRVRLPMEHDLQIGDLLIYKGQPEWGMYLYLGEDLGFANMSRATLDADTLSVDIRLEQLLGCDYYFAILRPSMTQ